ncbi:MAG: prenyltransferase, partial [Chloroflexi bacterium]|nr:prenyltransferase [Chloroflexota bacterium]
SYYLQTGTFAAIPTLAAVPIGISIFLVILINEFPDYVSDRASHKNNMVVRLGPDRAAVLYGVMAVLCALSIPLGLLGGMPRLMAPLSVIPLALVIRSLLWLAKGGYKEPQTLEKLCAATLVLNLGTTALYIVAFAL